jgi:alkyl hydroperoxide reductase 1
MAPLKAGDPFPENVAFQYIPWSEDQGEITSCGIPIKYDASKEWADKKVVLFSVPGAFATDFTLPGQFSEHRSMLMISIIGAFTPTCSVSHLPGYIQNLPQLKEKGVQIVAVVASNDPFVMSAWGKANQVTGDDIVRSDLATDPCHRIKILGDRTQHQC